MRRGLKALERGAKVLRDENGESFIYRGVEKIGVPGSPEALQTEFSDQTGAVMSLPVQFVRADFDRLPDPGEYIRSADQNHEVIQASAVPGSGHFIAFLRL